MFALFNAANGAADPNHPMQFGGAAFVFVWGFANWSIVFGEVALVIIVLRLLSAGHRRLLIDLEQKVVKLLRETPEGNTRALCSAIDAAEARVIGAMSISNKRMQTTIWLV